MRKRSTSGRTTRRLLLALAVALLLLGAVPSGSAHSKETSGSDGDDPHCDVTLKATADEDESITLEAVGLDSKARLLRGGEHVADLDEDAATFRDNGTKAGVTYTYRLMVDGEACTVVEVSAIPVFPSLLAATAALGGGGAAYLAMRRR